MFSWIFYQYQRVRDRRGLTLGAVLGFLLLCLLGNAATFLYFESALRPELRFADALWYSAVSVTTIGYGDLAAQTTGARLGTVLFIILLGLSTFTIFFGMLIDAVAAMAVRGQYGMGSVHAVGHVLVVNFPGELRVHRLIDELRSDAAHAGKDIVIVADGIERLPFIIDRVSFVRGSPLQVDTYERAAADRASMALVLATDYGEGTSDAIAAGAISVLNGLNPGLHVVAECIDERHRPLFASVRCHAVVPGLRIVGNLLAQEASDPGVARMIDVITSNLEGDTVYSARVSEAAPELGYRELAKRLLDHDVNVLCVNRAGDSHTRYGELYPTVDDQVLYVASRRLPWAELIALAR